MIQLLQKKLDIRANETKRLFIMAGYIFVIIASYNVLKPMTRSLFVTNIGLGQLPYLFMILAVVVAFFVMFYLRFSARLKLDRLLNITMFALMASLLLFRWLLQLNIDTPLLYYSLYIWASIYGVLTTSQFWLLANYVFNAREAKRLFSILTAFALAGAIMGGYFTSFLVKVIGGTSNLAFFCFGLLGAAQILMNLAWRHRDKSMQNTRWAKSVKEEDVSFRIIGETFSLIKNSRHLAFLVCIVALTYMVVQIADFQFVAFASEEISDVDDLTGFLGLWLSNLSIFALIFQVLFANSILKRFGVGATVLFLPITLLVTSAWVFVSYGLISILAIKVGDGAFRHSINKVGMELFYLPIPQEIKKKTKTFIDMFVDRFARGLAGAFLVVFYTWLGFNVAQVGLLSIILSGLWIVLAVATYREYVNSFRQAITRRQIDLEASSVTIKDEATIDSLLMSLASKNERQVIYALQVLKSVDGVNLEPALIPLFQHSSAEVRKQALALTHAQRLETLAQDVRPLLNDSEETVRRETVRVLVEFSDNAERLLSDWLASDDIELRAAALHYLAGKDELAQKLLSPALIESFLKEGTRARAVVAEAVGVLKNDIYYSYLNQLLHDEIDVVRSLAIASSGKTQAKQFVPVLIQNLESRAYRKSARTALAEYGSEITDQLANYLQNASVDLQIRSEIPKVLSLIGSQKSVEVLLAQLGEPIESLRYQIIKALNKLRSNFPDLNFDNRVDGALLNELKKYFNILSIFQLSSNGNHSKEPAQNLLSRALQERLDDYLERVFRLLGLRYSPKDIYNAFAATTSENNAIRANAIEFLDNILTKNHKNVLLPIVEDLPAEQVLQHAGDFFNIFQKDEKEALSNLIEGNDAWLSACALYHVGVSGKTKEFRSEIKNALDSHIPVVNETANLVVKQFA